jgi:hypothetical protein
MKRACSLLFAIVILISSVTALGATESKYAYLKVLGEEPIYGYDFTVVDGHYYGISVAYDDMEEEHYYRIKKDGREVYAFEPGGQGPRGIVQVNGTVYVALIDGIYKYSSGKLTLLTDNITGYIHNMTTNGKDMFILCDDDSPADSGAYLEGVYYKVSTKGAVTAIQGDAEAVGYDYIGFSVNKDEDRLARVAFNEDGVTVRRTNGTEYVQRMSDLFDYDDYSVDNVIYYNNCLIANVKGSLVYYDKNGKRQLLMGDMLGSRSDRESWSDQALGSMPIETGRGDSVKIGYVLAWTIGDDGYIYGVSMDYYDRSVCFKLTIPDFVKNTTTYKKKG